jgi:hypothetical protein
MLIALQGVHLVTYVTFFRESHRPFCLESKHQKNFWNEKVTTQEVIFFSFFRCNELESLEKKLCQQNDRLGEKNVSYMRESYYSPDLNAEMSRSRSGEIEPT